MIILFPKVQVLRTCLLTESRPKDIKQHSTAFSYLLTPLYLMSWPQGGLTCQSHTSHMQHQVLPDTGVSNLRLAGATLCPVQAESHSTVSKDWENEPRGWGEFMTM